MNKDHPGTHPAADHALVDDGACFFRTLVDHLPDLICRYRTDSTLLYVNEAYARFHGSTPEDMVGRPFLDFLDDDIRAIVSAKLAELVGLADERPVTVNEHQATYLGGKLRWVEWTDQAVFGVDGTLDGFAAVGRDVTDRRMVEEQARHLANHDPLTNLANRRRAIDGLNEMLEHLNNDRRSGDADCPSSNVGVLYLDIDGFKVINDQQGHKTGDLILRAVAAAMRSAVREVDLVGRVGGDEFVIVTPGVHDASQLDQIVDRIRFELDRLTPPVRISAGGVLARPGEAVEAVVHRADQAMYADKQIRRGQAG